MHVSREESSLSVPRVWTIAAIWINFQLPMRRHTRCIILHLGLVVLGGMGTGTGMIIKINSELTLHVGGGSPTTAVVVVIMISEGLALPHVHLCVLGFGIVKEDYYHFWGQTKRRFLCKQEKKGQDSYAKKFLFIFLTRQRNYLGLNAKVLFLQKETIILSSTTTSHSIHHPRIISTLILFEIHCCCITIPSPSTP